MDAIIVAGGIPQPDDPLAVFTENRPKVLLDVCGHSMLARIVAAFTASPIIEQIVVVGLPETCRHEIAEAVIHLPDHGGVISNARAGLEWIVANRSAGHVVLATGDIPLIQAAMIDDFVAGCEQPLDRLVYYRFVRRRVMDARFPRSERTFTRLRDVDVTQADLAVVHSDILDTNQALWESIVRVRKQPWRMARVVGLRTLLKLVFRRLTIAGLEATAQRILGAPVSVGFTPYAELAMDVDKPHHLEVVRRACATAESNLP
jgi:GTP:adenosylcobinamide-phosphate guanylyltransferase